MAKIIHKKNNCIGCGLCASICPEIFEMTENYLAKLKNSKENNDVSELEISATEVEKIKCAKNAADACPVKIIIVED